MTEAALHDDWPPGLLFRPPRQIGWQTKIIIQSFLMRTALLAVDTGLGKAQPVSEPVHTPRGFVPMGSLRVGDLVTGSSGAPVVVTGVFPQGVREVYKVRFNDGSWTRATGDHLWQVQTKNGITRKYHEVLTTEEILRAGIRDGGGNRKYRIPVVSPVCMSQDQLPVDPYLLGVLLGDGSIISGTPSFTTADQELVDAVSEVIPEGTSIKPVGRYGYNISSSRFGRRVNPLTKDLVALGVWGHRAETKFIPKRYLEADLPARLALFQGLMDTDGTAGTAVEFSSSSKRLADDVLYLVQSLGGVVKGGVRERKTPRLPHYRVVMSLPNVIEPFRLSRKAARVSARTKYHPSRWIDSIVPDGFEESQCISVSAADNLYATRDFVLTHNSMMTMGVSGFAFEEDQIDLTVIICEKNKLTEWQRDFARFTRLSSVIYYGPKAKRDKILAAPLPQVLITTYETWRGDIAVFPPKGSRSRTLTPGPVMKIISGKRILIAYDEISRLGRRGSQFYKAHAWALAQLRKGPVKPRVLGLTATPMDTDLDNIFNEMRLVVPEAMPTVKLYESTVVTSRHPVYKTPSYSAAGKEWFRARCEPWIIRMRKTDPEVAADFPEVTEKFRSILMRDDQYQAYRALEDLAWNPDGTRKEVPGLGVLLRLMAGDPLAVLESARAGNSELAVAVAEEMGAELAGCSSAKADELISLADLVMSGSGKIMAFTRFAHTVLPVLKRRLGDDRTVFTYHGGMNPAERDRQLAMFRDYPGGAVMLASDAGARGINVPWADVIVEYELATLHSVREQRKGRGDRLGRKTPLTFISFVLQSTIEGASHAGTLLGRNAMQDFMLRDDEDERYMTAADRRALYAQARPRKAG